MQEQAEVALSVEESSSDVFTGKIINDNDTANLKLFHDAVKRHYIQSYCSNSDSLLDVGAGKLRDLAFWDEANIKNVVTIEPSEDSYQFGERRLKETPHRVNVKRIHGGAHEDWFADRQFSSVRDHCPFDCITFMFSIHFLMGNWPVLLRKISRTSARGTHIIILFMDGENVERQLSRNNGVITIANNNQRVFEISRLAGDEITVFMKGIYGLNAGTREYLVRPDKLLRDFRAADFTLVENTSFKDLTLPERDLLTPTQQRISNFNQALILVKN